MSLFKRSPEATPRAHNTELRSLADLLIQKCLDSGVQSPSDEMLVSLDRVSFKETRAELNENGFMAAELADEGFDCRTLGVIAAVPAETWRGAPEGDTQTHMNIQAVLDVMQR